MSRNPGVVFSLADWSRGDGEPGQKVPALKVLTGLGPTGPTSSFQELELVK